MVEFSDLNMETNSDDHNSQRAIIEDSLKHPLKIADKWYLVDALWFRNFRQFVGLEGTSLNVANPGPIDNSRLLDEEAGFGELKNDLLEAVDYAVLPALAWRKLVSWYGIKDNNRAMVIERKVVQAGEDDSTLRIEVYRVELTFFDNSAFENGKKRMFSCSETLLDAERFCKDAFELVNDEEIQFRCYYGPDFSESHILNKSLTIFEESLNSKAKIVIENLMGEPIGSFPVPAVPRSKEASRIPRVNKQPGRAPTRRQNFPGGYGTSEGRGAPAPPGVVGIMNLGNTCFLNSILQCLSNCGPVTQHFLDDKHLSELNVNNPLGRGGQLASAFADVIKLIWSGKHSTVAPSAFKLQLTRFAPQFAGCHQHDAQELLTFLLDGLHEDLNRATEKPYRESVDSEENDETLAIKSWEYLCKRNDSIVIDHFHGMLKSRVVCPDCETVSTKFDTFSSLSLPLPQKYARNMKVRFIPYEQSQRPKELLITLPTKGMLQDMADEVGKIINIDAKQLVIAEITKHHFHKFFSMDDAIESISDRDIIHIYDVPAEKGHALAGVVLWGLKQVQSYPHFLLSDLFGTSFLVSLPQGPITFQDLYKIICQRLQRSSPGFLEELERAEDNTMECDPAETGEGAAYSPAHEYMFGVAVVNTFTLEVTQVLGPGGDDCFVVPDHFGRCVLALQIQPVVRATYYRDPEFIFVEEHIRSVKSPRITLEDCLTLFSATEKLEESEAWRCPKCNAKKRATKSLDIWKLPNIIIFHLKRFAHNEIKREVSMKLETKVEFPLTNLNLDSHVINNHKENLVYDLIGVCNHYGNLTGGHYTAFCKNFQNEQWYCFDDSCVTPIWPTNVQTENAYVLFYQKRPTPQPEDKGEM